MKKFYLVISLIIFVLINVACSDEPPSIRIKNERTSKVNVQIKQANGNTININDVEGGTITGYREIVEGATEATAVIQDEQVSPSLPFRTVNDRNYTVAVTNSTPPTIRIDSEDK